MEADGAVDAQNAPTVPWKTLCVFHELPQGLSNQITHEKPRKAPKMALGNPDRPVKCVVGRLVELGHAQLALDGLEIAKVPLERAKERVDETLSRVGLTELHVTRLGPDDAFLQLQRKLSMTLRHQGRSN